MLLEISGEITPERMKRWSPSKKQQQQQQQTNTVVDVMGEGSKVRCCKEQYCIGTWNVRSMNQGKLDVVKQEMPRVYIDILRICKQKWTGMDEFNSDDHYIYYCGPESPVRHEIAIIVNKRVCNAVRVSNIKNKTTKLSQLVSKANHSISQ